MVEADPIRALTRRLSELLAGEDGGLVLAHAQKLRLLSALGDRMDRRWTVELDTEPKPVGAWRPCSTAAGLAYVRRDDLPAAEAKYWAADAGIPPKGDRRRIVLVGESVARGYLFDPELCFADVLRGLTEDEVVDLACTNLTAEGLQHVIAAMPALQPDAVIVFAGNNWDNLPLGLAELDRCAQALRVQGFRGVRSVFQNDLLLPGARAAVTTLAALRSVTGAQVTVVVPETNLADWQPERSVRTAMLPGHHTATWFELYEQARAELAVGHLAAVADLARRLTGLDGGVSPASQFLLGTALHSLGECAAARTALEAARDSYCGLLVPHPPRCPSLVQEVLRAACGQHDLRLVDLPALFQQHTGDLPGRRMFLDYCHLTEEGMRVAAAAALGVPVPPVTVAPAVAATAHLLAALHNAHYGQPATVIRHHLQVALDTAPQIAPVAAGLAQAQAVPWPSWLTAAFAAAGRAPQAARYLVPDNPNRLAKTADHEFVRLVAGHLGQPGDQPATDGRIDLVTPQQHAQTFQEHAGFRMGGAPAYYRAHEPSSTFYLMCGDGQSRHLRVTARIPDRSGTAGLWLNGEPLATMLVGARWAVAEFDAPANRLGRRPDRLEIRWPRVPQCAERFFEHGARRLERGELPDVLPVFGEVHSFVVTPAGATPL